MSQAIAIVGMAGRFPGARNLDEFWRNLYDGVEAIRDRSDAELLAAGVTRAELADPDYVRRSSMLAGVPLFDAAFFGMSPRDASIMDPQHRHFLEVAWEALETAGHVPQSFAGSIGVFAGSGMNTYLIHNLLRNRKLLESAGLFQLKQTGNDKDVLATRVSYQFDLRGPAINIQTACSTSLVAIHLASQSLLNFECDMALAGGVTIEVPHGQGYVYREGEILARDGHCRAFDRESTGTVFASGLGVVALRRLDDALADHDTIRAVILGSAINNDGARKVGYLAPSVEGQVEVIAEALDYAGLSADDITYVETHGTGTRVGDPIEVRALTQAFRRTTTRHGYCGIGSLKPSVGHLDAAAGVAGVIKTTLALEHATLPESLNFDTINPHIELASSPFYINNRRRKWSSPRGPRRAGVTSLGIGGTNAHVLLEEAPKLQLTRDAAPYRLLTVSAKTEAAADQALGNLVRHLEAHPEVKLADAALTCVVGRQSFAHRRALAVADDASSARTLDPALAVAGTLGKSTPRIVFLFEDRESLPANLAREFYEHESAYRDAFIACAQAARALIGVDLVTTLYPAANNAEASATLLQTPVARATSFAVQYALAAWWRAQGVQPAHTAGAPFGASIAACLSGGSLAEALKAAVDAPSSSIAPGVDELAAQAETVFVHLGTAALASSDARIVRTLPEAGHSASALATALTALGSLWTLGVEVDLAARFKPASAQRIPLPTYPFEHHRYWIESDADAEAGVTSSGESNSSEVLFYQRPWKRVALPVASRAEASRWLIFRENDALADRLVELLRAAGNDVVTIESGTSFKKFGRDRYRVRTAERADYEALLTEVLRDGPVPTTILHLWPAGAAERPIEESLARCFHAPLALAQAIIARDLSGIDVGFVSRDLRQTAGERVVHPERALFDGPARVWPKEQPGIHCRSIDLSFNKGEESAAAALLIAEMNAPGIDATVAYRNGERWQETLERYTPAHAPRRTGLIEGGVYLITGGVGALGLVVAEQIAQKAHARLILTSRSALPAQSEWETLAADKRQSDATLHRMQQLLKIRSHAAGLLCVAADVTDVAAMRAAIAEGEAAFGPLDGVFHVAGVLRDAPIALKSHDAATSVLAPKVLGTLALAEALGSRKLSSFVLFSSVSAVDAPAGQVDYAAANAFLDSFAASRNGQVLAANWGAWRAVGMAARNASPHPWLDEKLLDTPDAAVFSGRFSMQRRWVLADHRFINGQALIPGTGYLELAAGAFMRGSLDGAIEFQDVYFLAPFMVSGEEQRELRVQLKREAGQSQQSSYRFSVFGQSLAAVDAWTEHATGSISRYAALPVAKVDRAAIAARCTRSTLVFDGERRTKQERTLDFGPRWRTLRRLQLGQDEALAEIELGEQWCADIAHLRQHPALLDMATGAALYLTPDYESTNDLYLPISYRRMRVYRTLPARLLSHIRIRPASGHGEVATFDIVLFNEQNEVLAEIEGFAMRRIQDTAAAMTPGGLTRTANSGERPIEISSRPGIAPEAGARALIELLEARTPAVVVAVHEPLAARAPSESAPSAPAATTEANPTPAPSGDLASTLTAWWKEMLGVDHVGLDDDFFTLGGHSLIGVRLFAKIKRTLGVELELATLFEARTVRQLAELIGRKQAPSASDEAPRAWKSLVLIQPKGTRPPLFCVHAVGGDVIFYEQLARALGPDQPFVAFQSPLVAEPDRRDLSLEKIAALYIEEMRAYYPQGPYLLGGASYGGFVLYEMARQLVAAGIEPGLVAMFDVVIPESTVILPKQEKYARLWQQIRTDKFSYLRRKIAEKNAHFHELFRDRLLYPLGIKIYKRMGWPMTPALRFIYIGQGHWEALSRYKMEPFPGKITLVRATDRGPEVLGKREDPTLGWGRLAEGGLEVIDVPTKHMHMLFDPYVADFSVTLREMLERGAAKR